MASLERQGINRFIGTWKLEGGCHIRPTADARSSNSNCRIKHHITSLFVPSLPQNSDPPPGNLKAGLAYGTWDKHSEALCVQENSSLSQRDLATPNSSTALTRLSIPRVTQHRSHTRSEAKHSTRFPLSTTRATPQLAKMALANSPSSS